MTAMLTRIRLQAEGATINEVQATLFAASDAIHTLIYTDKVVPPHAIAGEHYEQATPPDRYHTRWYHGRAHLDFPLDHHAIDVDRLRGRDRELRGFDADHGIFAEHRYEAREYAWEGTGTQDAHTTYGVYDTHAEAELEGKALPGEPTGLVTGGLTKEQAERGAAALNMRAESARRAIYHAAMPGFYPPDPAPWASEPMTSDDPVPVIVAASAPTISGTSPGVVGNAFTASTFTSTATSGDEPPPDGEESGVPREPSPVTPSGSASVPLPGSNVPPEARVDYNDPTYGLVAADMRGGGGIDVEAVARRVVDERFAAGSPQYKPTPVEEGAQKPSDPPHGRTER